VVALAEYVYRQSIDVTEIGGPVVAAERCAQALATLVHRSVKLKTLMRIMQAQRVIPPRPASGAMRIAGPGDLELVLKWMDAFVRDIGETHPLPRQRIEQRVANTEYHFWEDPRPVSIAGRTGRTPTGVRINAVYTPPEFRGRGYASNLVAKLTQKLFDEGRKFCFLYTDAANPTSNKIYEAIGYEFVCEWVNLELVPQHDKSAVTPRSTAAHKVAGTSGSSPEAHHARPGR
jgi:predicted GNAT family acetyltransferase